VAVRLKSPMGAGVEPPPQDTNRSKQRKLIHPARAFEEALIANPRARPAEFTSIWSACASSLARPYTGPLHRLS
jgi:hypothetical protein